MATPKLQGGPVPVKHKIPVSNPIPKKPPSTIHKAPKPPPKSTRPSRVNRQQIINRAVGSVRNQLMEAGMSPDLALKYAVTSLQRPGVKLARGGKITNQNRKYSPANFIKSPLVNLVTGKTAQNLNTKAIQGDPDYLQAIANLQLTKDQATSGLDDQRRQAVIQYGDPGFAGGDATLAGEAAANPFSTAALQAEAYKRQQATTNQQANVAGTYYGGGVQSGQNEATRSNAANVQDSTIQIQNLLSGLGQQQALANQAYATGQGQAQLDSYNNLLAGGVIHAATPPKYTNPGTYAVQPVQHIAKPKPVV